MKKLLFIILPLTWLIVACGGKNNSEAQKAQLSKLKEEAAVLKTKIETLEKEIAANNPITETLALPVGVFPIETKTFESFVEIQGVVVTKKNVDVAAEQGGTIIQVPVVEGQQIKKGQLLVTLDAEPLHKSLMELETAFDLAKTAFERQANLWKQQIGSEMQYLQAKNNKETMERRIESVKAQIAKSKIVAPFDGQVEMIRAKTGEMAAPGMPLVRVVNLADLEVMADVSEKFIGRFKVGDAVELHFPSIDLSVKQKIKSVGSVINPNNRTFAVITTLSEHKNVLKPNLLAVLKAKDRAVQNAIVVPTKLLQTDATGSYVFAVRNPQNNPVAAKVYVKTGFGNGAETVIEEGLKAGDLLIAEGAKNVAEGDRLKLLDK